MKAINVKKTGLFILLAFGLSWAVSGAFYLADLKYMVDGKMSIPGLLSGTLFMIMPAVAAIISQKAFEQEVVKPLAIDIHWKRWYWLAIFLFPVLMFPTQALSFLHPDIGLSLNMKGMLGRFEGTLPPDELAEMQQMLENSPWLVIVQSIAMGIVAGVSINAIAAFGEELGWRGLLHNELRPLGFWRLGLITGAIWGIWHAPLILQGHNFPDHPVAGVGMMALACMLMGPAFALIRIKTRSVLAASLAHGTLNGTYGISMMYSSEIKDLISGLFGLSGITVLALLNIAIFIYLKKKPLTEAQLYEKKTG